MGTTENREITRTSELKVSSVGKMYNLGKEKRMERAKQLRRHRIKSLHLTYMWLESPEERMRKAVFEKIMTQSFPN